jgi:uncharacterized protein (TIGR00251 family)
MVEVFVKHRIACFRVRVQPRASRQRIDGLVGSRLKVQLTAPPLDNRANQQLLECLAKALGVARHRLSILAGSRSRDKTVGLKGVSAEELTELLQSVLSASS